MIYTTADRLEHIASALETLSPEWSAQLKGMATYIRGIESMNFKLATELLDAQHAIEEAGNSISDADSEAMANVIRAAHDQALSDELFDLETGDLYANKFPTYRTLEDLIESLKP